MDQISSLTHQIILFFNYIAISYHVITNGFYLIFIILSIVAAIHHLSKLKYADLQSIVKSPMTPPISILVAAHNEELNIVESIRALLGLEYASYEVIVINDGSTDQTLERLIEGFDLRPINLIYRRLIQTKRVKGFFSNTGTPNLIVIDKEHGGKGDSLNAGINMARSPYFCSVDADSLLEKDALVRLIRPIIESSNPDQIVATGGIVRIANGCRIEKGRIANVALPQDSLSLFQIVEYLRTFLFGRTGWSTINSLLVISGTFSMFHKKTVQEAGGYSHDSVTEDMELVVRLHRFLRSQRRRYQISFVHDPICWTEVPVSIRMLARQRRRWHRGLVESLLSHLPMLFNPRFGRIGLIAVPYHLLIEGLGPIIELSGYFIVLASFIMGVVDFSFFMLFISLSILFGVFLSTGAIMLEEFTYRRYPRWTDLMILLAYGVLENFGYRQMNAWWRLQSLFQLFRTRRWEHVRKHGFPHSDHQRP